MARHERRRRSVLAGHYRPDADLLWSWLNKAKILEIAFRTFGPDWAAARAKSKKSLLLRSMARAFGGDDAAAPSGAGLRHSPHPGTPGAGRGVPCTGRNRRSAQCTTGLPHHGRAARPGPRARLRGTARTAARQRPGCGYSPGPGRTAPALQPDPQRLPQVVVKLGSLSAYDALLNTPRGGDLA